MQAMQALTLQRRPCPVPCDMRWRLLLRALTCVLHGEGCPKAVACKLPGLIACCACLATGRCCARLSLLFLTLRSLLCALVCTAAAAGALVCCTEGCSLGEGLLLVRQRLRSGVSECAMS